MYSNSYQFPNIFRVNPIEKKSVKIYFLIIGLTVENEEIYLIVLQTNLLISICFIELGGNDISS
jgi:hypothetical protein